MVTRPLISSWPVFGPSLLRAVMVASSSTRIEPASAPVPATPTASISSLLSIWKSPLATTVTTSFTSLPSPNTMARSASGAEIPITMFPVPLSAPVPLLISRAFVEVPRFRSSSSISIVIAAADVTVVSVLAAKATVPPPMVSLISMERSPVALPPRPSALSCCVTIWSSKLTFPPARSVTVKSITSCASSATPSASRSSTLTASASTTVRSPLMPSTASVICASRFSTIVARSSDSPDLKRNVVALMVSVSLSFPASSTSP